MCFTTPAKITAPCNSPGAERGNGFISLNGIQYVWFSQVKQDVEKVHIFC